MNESEIKAEINRLQNLLKEKESFKLPRSSYNHKYFYISKFTNGIDVGPAEDYLDSMDNRNYKQFNYFVDEEKANRFAEHIKLTLELFQVRDVLNGDWEPDWNDDSQIKYTLMRQKNELVKIINYSDARSLSFQTNEKRDKFIEFVGKDKIIKFLSF